MTVSLGRSDVSEVISPTTKPASVNRRLASSRFSPVTSGIGCGSFTGLKYTSTAESSCTIESAGGMVWNTWSSGTSAFSWATGVTDRPAWVKAWLACSMVMPTTLGTATVVGATTSSFLVSELYSSTPPITSAMTAMKPSTAYRPLRLGGEYCTGGCCGRMGFTPVAAIVVVRACAAAVE